MSRHNKSSSYGHRCRKDSWGGYVISWTWDRYYDDSRLRYPQTAKRDTDAKGADAFCRRWGCDRPDGLDADLGGKP